MWYFWKSFRKINHVKKTGFVIILTTTNQKVWKSIYSTFCLAGGCGKIFGQQYYLWIGLETCNMNNFYLIYLKKNTNQIGNKELKLKNYISKGNCALADLRYGNEDSISPSTLIFSAIKG